MAKRRRKRYPRRTLKLGRHGFVTTKRTKRGRSIRTRRYPWAKRR